MLVYLAGILFIGGLVYIFFFSDLLKVKAVELKGDISLDQALVIEKTTERLLNRGLFYKLLGRNNIFFWPSSLELTDISDISPRLSSLKVERNLLTRKVQIEANERSKFIIWCEGDCFWIDETGLAFADAPETEGPLVKIVRVTSGRQIKLGDSPLSGKETGILTSIINFLNEMNIPVKSLTVENQDYKEITAQTLTGSKVYFSFLVDPVFGKSVVESLKEDGSWSKIDYLDLRIQGRAYYKLR